MIERSIKWYAELKETANRRATGYFLVEGINAVSQILAVAPTQIEEILYADNLPLALAGYSARQISQNKLKQILTGQTPSGLAALVKVPADLYSNDFSNLHGDKILLLEDISDPGNLGTLVRSASALGFNGVVLTTGGCDILSSKVVAATAGTLFSLWIRRVENAEKAISYFSQQGYKIVGTSPRGTQDTSVLSVIKLLLILGNEAKGLSNQTVELCHSLLRLPIDSNKAESLNVAVAGSICMYLAMGKC